MQPLHHAALLAGDSSNNDAAGLVRALATPGTIDHKARDDETPLLFAAWGGHHDVISALLGQGADPLVPDRCGVTPLHLAAHGGHADCVRSLMAAAQERTAGQYATGAIKDAAGHTAADVAASTRVA
eukprot:SAG31_NODE_8409_length_1457_cov_1.311487_1_plen_126_part_10